MNTLSLYRAALGAVVVLALAAAPASAAIDGTSNTLQVAEAVAGHAPLNSTKANSFQGGCSRGSDTCLMETDGLYPPA
jgi:hypothetical protein